MTLPSSQKIITSGTMTMGIPEAIHTAFIAYLNEKGYKTRTQTLYQAVVERFSCRLEALNIPISAVTYVLAQDFLKTLPVNAPMNINREALYRFIEFLDTQRLPLSGNEPASSIDQTLQRYTHYVESVCGLAPKTCQKRRQIVRTFLGWLEQQAIELDALHIPVFINYFSDYGQTHQPSSTRSVTHIIRHYLRFEQLQGRDTQSLIAAIPKVAPWPLSALPIPLDDAQLERLLSVFDRTTSAGQRDFAMARCLVDLGLRASEVAALRLDDIDWQSGCYLSENLTGSFSNHF